MSGYGDIGANVGGVREDLEIGVHAHDAVDGDAGAEDVRDSGHFLKIAHWVFCAYSDELVLNLPCYDEAHRRPSSETQ